MINFIILQYGEKNTFSTLDLGTNDFVKRGITKKQRILEKISQSNNYDGRFRKLLF